MKTINIPVVQRKAEKIYTIEFLRVFFVFFIILGHIIEQNHFIKENVLNFFNTKIMHTWFGVEFFFIIGGFFLYNRILSTPNIFTLIKKIYTRLLPPLLFVFFLCVISGICSFNKFPTILSLTTGLTIPGEVTGWGDWYVGVYFWCSLLFISLFSNNLRQGFLWASALSYITLCLKFNAPYDGWMKTYYTVIGNQLVRGIYSMGLGITAAYLSDKVRIIDKIGVTLFFGAFEIYCLISIFTYIARTSHTPFNFWEIEIIFALFLISTANSLGFISKYLNKFKKIHLISRYSYSIFLGHIPFISFLHQHQNYDFTTTTFGLIIMGGAILTGVIEYHLIEKKVIPWIVRYFKKEVA